MISRYFFFLIICSMWLFACTEKEPGVKTEEPAVLAQSSDVKGGMVKTQVLASGLDHPWAIAFLPDGRALITERSGSLRIMEKDRSISAPLSGVPKVHAKGQGGLLDVAIDPDFENNRMIYLSFAEPGPGNTASTALGRGVLEEGRISGFKVIFSQEPKVDGNNHFGSRIVFQDDEILFLTLAERFKFEPAQDLAGHLGKIIRIRKDGSVPPGNPFTEKKGARPEIWSYGHRNIQSAALDGQDRLWVAEMGPQGGDELNLVEKGENYGWPLVSHGEHYNGRDIPDHSTRPEFRDAKLTWTPVIAPSGMLLYDGKMFPEWKGNLLIGGLMAQGIVRVSVSQGSAQEIERISLDARTRDLAVAADGSVWAVTDEGNGKVIRVYR